MTKGGKIQWVNDAPADAGTREQLIAAANEHFGKYGYDRTTLADLAKAIGFSKTYFYRFFESKREIGEAVCSQILGTILAAMDTEIEKAPTNAEKLRSMLRTIPRMGVELFFHERKLHDVCATSATDGWNSSQKYVRRLEATLDRILLDGRTAGEFERKTPTDELNRAILMAMRPFIDPRVLQFHVDFVGDRLNEVIALILRGLAP